MNDFILPYRRYAQFTGRSGRKEFWYFFLFCLVVGAVLSIVDSMLFGSHVVVANHGWMARSNGPLQAIFGLASLIPSIAVAMRRLHDTGKSGWWLLLSIVPVAGWIVLLIFYCQKGDPAPNAHGAPPESVPAIV